MSNATEASATKATSYQAAPFTFESVSLDDIASFAWGQALNASGIPMQHTNTGWFRQLAKHRLAHQWDVSVKDISFEHFDVHPNLVSSPDGFYYTVEGRWWCAI